MNPFATRFLYLPWLLLAACQSQQGRSVALPFHVAMTPVAIERTAHAASAADAEASALALTFDEGELSRAFANEMRTCFAGVTTLSAPKAGGLEVGQQAWVQEARAAGADLIVDATLTYDPTVTTALNDRFWLNLPLFALGGPFAWFVADRSYRCQGKLEVQVFDLGASGANGEYAFDDASRVVRVDRQAEAASLNLVDRAAFPHYVLSLLIPAGLVGPESAAVPDELRKAITAQLARAIVGALQERSEDLARGAAVDFHPEGVHVEQDARGGRSLVGEIVLELGSGNASELGQLKFRFDHGAFQRAEWGDTRIEAHARSGGRKHHAFRIPLGSAAKVQMEVEQRDRFASRRTFTYLTGVEKKE